MVRKVTTIEDLAALIQRTMATKEDLEGLATKQDLEAFATKEDLKGLASKEDLRKLEQRMEDGFLDVNRRIDLLHEDISDLPDIRDEVRDLDRRVNRVERKVGIAG